MKNVLMLAYHYPPFAGGSGVHRTLKFTHYLPQFNWRPLVLTVHPRAYPQIGFQQMKEIPPEAVVGRAFALDASRHLAIHGRYFKLMALPDRWVSWWIGGFLKGLLMIRRYQPEVIWSTYPIATAHLIGLTLSRCSGIPLVADFRDSMTEEGYPPDRLTRRCYQWIEKKVIAHSSLLVFTAASTKRMYLDRYPWLSSLRCEVIPNGYDEEDFKELSLVRSDYFANDGPIRLVHSGVVYPEERDPRPFFNALAKLKRSGYLHAKNLEIVLRGSGSEELYSTVLKELNIADVVLLLPVLPYHQSLQECAGADALLILQGSCCNHQIPAKAYEYLRMQKPILALTDEGGDTGSLLKECGGATIIDMKNECAIYEGFPEFMRKLREHGHSVPVMEKVQRYSRKNQTRQLAMAMGRLVGLKNQGSRA